MTDKTTVDMEEAAKQFVKETLDESNMPTAMREDHIVHLVCGILAAYGGSFDNVINILGMCAATMKGFHDQRTADAEHNIH